MLCFTRRIDTSEMIDDEGLCYDLERARREGLFETIYFDAEELMEAAHYVDASVNVPPYTHATFDLLTDVAMNRFGDPPEVNVTYMYHYGRFPSREGMVEATTQD